MLGWSDAPEHSRAGSGLCGCQRCGRQSLGKAAGPLETTRCWSEELGPARLFLGQRLKLILGNSIVQQRSEEERGGTASARGEVFSPLDGGQKRR